MRAVTDGPSSPLALGVFFGQDANTYRLWHSVDGVRWEPTPLPRGKDLLWSTNDIWRSTDLQSWDSAWTSSEAWDDDGSDAFQWVVWAGDHVAVVRLDFRDCAPRHR